MKEDLRASEGARTLADLAATCNADDFQKAIQPFLSKSPAGAIEAEGISTIVKAFGREMRQAPDWEKFSMMTMASMVMKVPELKYLTSMTDPDAQEKFSRFYSVYSAISMLMILLGYNMGLNAAMKALTPEEVAK